MLREPRLGQAQKGLIAALLCFAFAAIIFDAQPWLQTAPSTKSISAQRPKNEHANHKENIRYGVTTNDWLALFTLGLLLVGAVQAGLFYRQLVLIRKGLKPAQDAAEAAKLNAQAVMEAERAHLYPIVKDSNVRDVLKEVSRYGVTDDGPVTSPHLTFHLKNYGKTPAIIEHISCGISFHRLDQQLLVLATDSVAHQPLGIITADGRTAEIPCAMSSVFSRSQVRAVLQHEAQLIFHGEHRLRDFFNRSFNCSWQFLGGPDGFNLMRIEEREIHPQQKKA